MVWGKSPERRVVMPAGALTFPKSDIRQKWFGAKAPNDGLSCPQGPSNFSWNDTGFNDFQWHSIWRIVLMRKHRVFDLMTTPRSSQFQAWPGRAPQRGISKNKTILSKLWGDPLGYLDPLYLNIRVGASPKIKWIRGAPPKKVFQ